MSTLNPLTPRERQVFDLAVQGMSSKAIAARLGISERTARDYVSTLHSKLYTRNRIELALVALRQEAQG